MQKYRMNPLSGHGIPVWICVTQIDINGALTEEESIIHLAKQIFM